MSILRISKIFDYLDTSYSELYENQVNFEKNITIESREKVLKSINKVQHHLSLYKASVKDLYIKGDLIGFKIDK